MFSVFERTMAFRYLRARRQEGFVSVIAGFSFAGIVLGVAALIIVMSVMNGFRQELLGRILGVNGHVTIYGIGSDLHDYDALAAELRGVPGVLRATPIVDGQVLASSGRGISSGALVRGIRPGDLDLNRAISGSFDPPNALENFSGGNAVIVGARLAQRLRLDVGDRIMLISPQGTATPFGTVPRALAYPIAGTFEVGMFEYDNGYVFMPLETAQKYFMMDDAVTGIEVFVNDPELLDETKGAIHGVLGGRARTYDWKQANAQFFGAIQTERNVMFIILTLIILVAAFNIVSSLIMLVKDKGSDIAILRTMGATRGSVMRIFFLAGATIGVVGTFCGFLAGVLFALNIETIRGWLELLLQTKLFPAEIYFLSRLPAEIDWGEVGAVVGLSLALSVLATIYPSWRAARLDPVEALRYE